jgi:GTP cyclohydrolase I
MRQTVTVDSEAVKKAVTDLLVAVGEDPRREGLASTPARVAELFEDLYSGVGVDPLDVLREAREVHTTPQERGDFVAVRDISFSSLCEHHLLPFSGVASVVYEPGDALLGLGTIAKLVEVVGKRPQLQERVGEMVARALVSSGFAKGALVLISATHGCVLYRGPKQHLTTVTVAAEGSLSSGESRHEALMLVGGEDWA